MCELRLKCRIRVVLSAGLILHYRVLSSVTLIIRFPEIVCSEFVHNRSIKTRQCGLIKIFRNFVGASGSSVQKLTAKTRKNQLNKDLQHFT